MPRARWILAAALGVAALPALRWLDTPRNPATAPAVDVAAPSEPPPTASPPSHTAREPATGGGPQPVEVPAARARADLLRSDPVLGDRARQHAWAPAADARWQQAVDDGGYEAGDLDPAVRRLFRALDLEPRYAADGMIDGLVIQSLPLGHPLDRAGFRPGDRIARIQGVRLRDPAEIPSLLARLGPNVELCAERAEAELCRELALE